MPGAGIGSAPLHYVFWARGGHSPEMPQFSDETPVNPVPDRFQL
jgi:hypothetical protein